MDCIVLRSLDHCGEQGRFVHIEIANILMKVEATCLPDSLMLLRTPLPQINLIQISSRIFSLLNFRSSKWPELLH